MWRDFHEAMDRIFAEDPECVVLWRGIQRGSNECCCGGCDQPLPKAGLRVLNDEAATSAFDDDPDPVTDQFWGNDRKWQVRVFRDEPEYSRLKKIEDHMRGNLVVDPHYLWNNRPKSRPDQKWRIVDVCYNVFHRCKEEG